MCLFYYRGEGYSGEFNDNMGRMKELLLKDPLVCLADGTDEICKACPHNRNGICASDSKVSEYDRQVLLRLGLQQGDIMRWLEFSGLVEKYILKSGRREEICGKCQWNRLCR